MPETHVIPGATHPATQAGWRLRLSVSDLRDRTVTEACCPCSMRSGYSINVLTVYLRGEQKRDVRGTFEASLPLRSENPWVPAAVYTRFCSGLS